VNDRPKTLTLARFEQLLDQCGADLTRFPERERAAAAALLAEDPRAQQLLAQAVLVERGLQSLPTPEPSAALRRAVAEIPLRHSPREAPPLRLPLRSFAALFASAALIVALGALSGAWASDRGPATQTAQRVEAEDGAEVDALTELTELAFAAELDEELSP
jgi:hypothetical protein